MHYENLRDQDSDSVVDGTVTTMAYYKEASISSAVAKNIKLSSVHHYKLKNFIYEMEKCLKVKTLFKSEQDGVDLILAQRPYS